MKVVSIKKIEQEPVYDITVEDQSHYVLENGIVTHNSGLKYAASTIAMLSKKKEKDGDEIIGNVIKVKMYKSRLSKEHGQAEVLLTYDKGLDRHYGLLDLAEKYEIIKKSSTRYELPDGSKVFGKEINRNPEKYFTDEIMARLEEAAKKEYSYGAGQQPQVNDSDD